MPDLFADPSIGVLDLTPPAEVPGRKAAARAWHFPEMIRPSVWMEDNIYLPAGTTASPGHFRFGARPYWRTVVDWCVEPDRQVVMIAASSQSAKTTTCMGLAGWAEDSVPALVNWFRETKDKVEEAGEKLVKIFRASPSLVRLLEDGRDGVRKGGMRFKNGGSLILDTAGGKTAMQGRDPWLVILDELDKCAEKNTDLGDLVGRAEKRILTWRTMGKVVGISTPTFDDKGIWAQWMQSQQWEWHIPCPDCGVSEALSFFGRLPDGTAPIDYRGIDKVSMRGGVRWERLEDGSHPDPQHLRDAKSAWYECPHCGHKTNETDKPRFVGSGCLECITPDRSPRRSAAHLSGLISPDYSWSHLAALFLEALKSPAKMVVFITEVLALPQVTRKQKEVAKESLEALKSSTWSQGSDGVLGIPPIPKWIERLYFAADAQQVEFWGVLEGVGYEGESMVLWAGRIDSKDDVRKLDTAIWAREDGTFLSLAKAGIDTGDGNRTHELYHMISKLMNFHALKGNARIDKPLVLGNQDFKNPDGTVTEQGIVLYSWKTTHFQDMLQAQINRGGGPGDGALHLPADCPRAWFDHIRSERRVEKIVDKEVRWVWEPVYASAPNHLRDAHCMAKVLAFLDGWAHRDRPVPVTGDENADYLALISGRAGA